MNARRYSQNMLYQDEMAESSLSGGQREPCFALKPVNNLRGLPNTFGEKVYNSDSHTSVITDKLKTVSPLEESKVGSITAPSSVEESSFYGITPEESSFQSWMSLKDNIYTYTMSYILTSHLGRWIIQNR